MESAIPQNSLVLYKKQPACVKRCRDKLEILLPQGKILKVRPKDVILLHPGPVSSLDQLQPRAGEVKTAWELLEGGMTTLADLADLAYGAFTPATAWSAWQLLEDGLYFRGSPGRIRACTAQEVDREQDRRRTWAAQEKARAAFLDRVRDGRMVAADGPYLEDVEQLALGRSGKSRVLRELGRREDPENAHSLLLELGRWDEGVNPYPQRFGLPSTGAEVELPLLPREERLDLTYLPAFAIDDEDSRHPDDALSLEGNRLWVHVADAAALVRPGSAADLEARRRGFSLYLPEETVPMLPPRAAATLALGLDAVSPALSFGLDLDSQGRVVDVELAPSKVRVTRMTYEQAQARIAQEPLRSLYRLSRSSRERRLSKKAVFIEWPEVKICLNDHQVHILPMPGLESRDMVAEAMLMAGEAAARFALKRGIPFPFTTQDSAGEGDEFPDGLAGMRARRLTLRRSRFTTSHLPHSGLGLDAYAQATSPLRRYLDLLAHQQLRACLSGDRPLDEQEVLERVGAAMAVSDSVRRAERLSARHWTLVFLLRNPGWTGEGILVHRQNRRCMVLIPRLGLEVPVHVSRDLPLNSSLPLALESVNLARLQARFQPLSQKTNGRGEG